MNKTLYILRGIPGSGKSSLAQLLVDGPLQIYSEDSRRILADIDSLRTWLENNY